VRRTPVCAIAREVPFRGTSHAVAAELFATTLDVYLLLGQIPEDTDDCGTANGLPATREAAHDRLARMLCSDRSECARDDAVAVAGYLAITQRTLIEAAVDRVLARQPSAPCHMVISGSGEFLAREIIAGHPVISRSTVISLAGNLSPMIAEAACAFAVARLAAERSVSGHSKATSF